MGTGGWGASRDHLCTGRRGFPSAYRFGHPTQRGCRRGGQARLLQTLGNTRTPTPAPRLLERGWPWVAQSGPEPRPRCRQRGHAAHGSVRLAAALLNCPEDGTKGKLLSAPLAALEQGCPAAGGSWSRLHPAPSGAGSAAPSRAGCDGSPGVPWYQRAIATVKRNSKTPVVHQVLSTEFPPGSLWGCWGRQGSFPSRAGREDADGGSAKRPGGRGQSCDAPAPRRAQLRCQDHGCLHAEFITAVLSLGSG